MKFLDEMIAQPGGAVFLALMIWSVSLFILRYILAELLRMHKSKTSVKKIKIQYSFWQKLALRHVAEHAEHAVKFTNILIWVHHLSFWTMAVCLLSWVVLSNRWFIYLLAGRFLLLDLPVWILEFLLDPHPFNRGKRRCGPPFRFNKYHNTSDKTSLF